MMQPQQLKRYLDENRYRNPDKTIKDVQNIFKKYKALLPKSEFFVFPTGEQKKLVALSGTIPVKYKDGNVYNIPLDIWLLDTHPFNAPMCYVRPTNTMLIKSSRSVDTNGRIYLPYLTEWKHPRSDLMALLDVLSVKFGQECPVYTKQAGAAQPSYGMPSPSGASAYPSYPPPRPSYPTPQQSYPQPPMYPPSSASSMYPQNNPYPATGVQAMPSPYTPPTSTAMPSSVYPPASSNTPYPPVSSQTGMPPVSSAATSTLTQNTSAYNGQPTEDMNETIRLSLISAAEDKLRRKLKEIFETAQREMDSLKHNKSELETGRAKIESILCNITSEQEQVDENIKMVVEKTGELEKELERAENREKEPVDQAIVPTCTLHKQIVDAFAEMNAYEDVIYYLLEALKKDVVPLDVYLKHLREVSRKIFEKKVIIQKGRAKANFAP